MKKIVVMTAVFAISAIVVMGCSNKKEATHPSVISSVESSCSRKDDPVNKDAAKRGGGSKVVGSDDMESSCSRKDDPVNRDAAKRGGGSKVVESKDETSLCICGKEDSVNDDSSTKSMEQTVQVNTPDTTAMQSVSTDTNDVLAKVPDYVKNYLTPTNDHDKNHLQFYIDFGRFLKDRGANGIMSETPCRCPDVKIGPTAYVSFKNGLILCMCFGKRLPDTIDYGWSDGFIYPFKKGFVNYNEELRHLFLDPREADAEWVEDYWTIPDPDETNYAYNEYFIVSPDEEFFRYVDGSNTKHMDFGDYHLIIHMSFFKTYEKVIEPYISLTDYSLHSDPLPEVHY